MSATPITFNGRPAEARAVSYETSNDGKHWKPLKTTMPKTNFPRMKNTKKKYSIVRTQSAGVFAGVIKSRKGSEAVVTDARRLWYWDGAASLSQLAVDGVSKPGNCKFPVTVPEVTLLNVVEILPLSDKAKASIDAVPVWKA